MTETIERTAVFSSTGQALHVAYLLEILPATQRVSTQILIESIRQQLGKVEARVASSINTGGMSPLEFRGQCAMVRAAAQNHLTQPEHDALRARFGHQRTKAEGVRGLAAYVAPMADMRSPDAMLACTWWVYHRPRRLADRYSLAQVAQQYGPALADCRRAVAAVRKAGAALEERGEARLTALFERTGLVAP